jgi:hypothetical protein
MMLERAMTQPEEMNNSNYLWLAELRSLGIFIDYCQMTNNDGFKDNKELQYLAD